MTEIQNGKASVLANNWDRFGGRALDILNGYVLSVKLGYKFVFYWPDDHRFPEMNEQVNFFSQAFIDKHRIKECPPAEDIYIVDFNLLDSSEAKRIAGKFQQGQFFKSIDFFSLPKFTDEDQIKARNFYAKTAKSVMSHSVLNLWEKLRLPYSEIDAVHGRYGDLVTGSFNQYVDTGKYIDTFSLIALVVKLNEENRQVVILSDTPQITKAIEKIFHTILRPLETTRTEGRNLTHFESQTIELFILASSKTIYASSTSAFSILASRIGNVPIKTIRQETDDVLITRPWELRRTRFYSKLDRRVRGQVRARDLMSILQFYWKSLDFEDVRNLINDAHKSDGEYVLALCCAALIARIELNSNRAVALIEKAESLARSRIKTHHDPLILTLFVKYFLVAERSSETAESIKKEFLDLHPFQFSKHGAWIFLTGCEELALETDVSSSVKPSKNSSWGEIVKSGEIEIIHALIKMLQDRVAD